MQRLKKREIVPFDESSFCGELAYGYSDKQEAIKAIQLTTGELIESPNDMIKLKVKRFVKKDGEIFYTWANKCDCCGQKIVGGVWSWADFN
jgi:hypothetical protein